jgi:hypothetical protein
MVHPRALSGRWGSIAQVERYILRMGVSPVDRMKNYQSVSRLIWGADTKKTKEGKSKYDGEEGGRGRGRASAAKALEAAAGRGRGRGSRGCVLAS